MIGMILLSLSSFAALLILPSRDIRVTQTLTAMTAFLMGSAFFYLVSAFLTSDLSFLNVALNSHTATDVLYKIAGVWGNHEGSMLLFLTLLTIVATIYALQRNVPIRGLKVLGAISLCFHLFILLVSNPFVQLNQVPTQGFGLNPLLEDPSLAIHPPILFTGLALLAVLYAHSCSPADKQWAIQIRPWALACWSFLTAGIALGSWWAYYELGWGGWWFWDPVENLSLLPWLLVTALLHTTVGLRKTGEYAQASPMLGVFSFVMALLGLCLVRSGALSSVHAFAIDPLRGGFLVAIFLVFFSYGIWRLIRPGVASVPLQLLSVRGLLLINILGLTAITMIVLFGTVYPLILNTFTQASISVGAPYFNSTCAPFLLVIMVMLSLLPYVSWPGNGVDKASLNILTIGLAACVGMWWLKPHWPLMALIFFGLSVCVIASTIMDMIKHRRLTSSYLAHLSLGVMVLGAVYDTADKVETVTALHESQQTSFLGNTITLAHIDDLRAPYFERQIATITVNNLILKPEKRYYPLHEMITTETAIHSTGLGDMHAILGTQDNAGQWTVKLYWHPAIKILWLGAILMIIAGLLGMRTSIRRLAILLMLSQPCQADDYKDLTRELYCPTCQGQVLDESNSPVAMQMKQEIRQRLDQGQSPEEILEHYRQLYGDKVLLTPPFTWHTALLWLMPVMVLMMGLGVIYRKSFKPRKLVV